MKKIKFVVKLSRGDVRSPEYVQRIDRVPIQMTTNRKLALLMGRFTAEDAIKSIQTSRCIPELVSVRVGRRRVSVWTRLCRAGLIALMSVTSAERFALWSPTEESHLHRRQPFLWSGDLARVPDQPTMSFLARSRVARPQEHAAAVRVS